VRRGRREQRETYSPPHLIGAPGDFVAADEHAHAVTEVGNAEDSVVIVDCVWDWDGAFCVVLLWWVG
jgi:hypothetical protein